MKSQNNCCLRDAVKQSINYVHQTMFFNIYIDPALIVASV